MPLARCYFWVTAHLSRKMLQRLFRLASTILIGMTPSQGRSFSGSKIAFTRIPNVNEFLE